MVLTIVVMIQMHQKIRMVNFHQTQRMTCVKASLLLKTKCVNHSARYTYTTSAKSNILITYIKWLIEHCFEKKIYRLCINILI